MHFQISFSYSLPGYMVRVQFMLPGSCGFFVLFSIRWLDFLVFWFEFFKLFPVKAQFFRRLFIFCTFCFLSWGFETALALRSHVIVIGHALASRDYIKVEQFRTWLLNSSLAEFKQFYSECFFQISFSYFLPGYMVHVQFMLPESCGSFVLFSIRWLDFLVLVWNFQKVPS